MGNGVQAGDRSAVHQCYSEAAGGYGWVGQWGVFGAWVEVGVSDRSSQSRNPTSRSHGTITPPLGPASVQLLQQRDTAQRKGGANALGPGVTSFAKPFWKGTAGSLRR